MEGAGSFKQLWGSSGSNFELTNEHPSPDTEYYFPAGLISVPDDIRYVFWTEFSNGNIYLLERIAQKRYKTLKRIPISIGKKGFGKEVEGDQKTPVGVYRVTSHIPEADLIDKYGLGAYPLNYPNNWDKLQKRTGYGIWLHGLPKGVEQRPYLDSDGCVVVDNTSLTFLDPYITTGKTLVVLTDQMEWVQTDSILDDPVITALDNWITAWESLNVEDYLSNYHRDFSDFNRDLAAWAAYKTRINSAKSFIKVSISDLTAVQYPGDENLVSTRFFQKYESSNFRWSGWKELFWKKDDNGEWKIVFEGNG